MASIEVVAEIAPFTETNSFFAGKRYVSVRRTARIFGVAISTVHEMLKNDFRDSRPALLAASSHRLQWRRILYSSIVDFCDFLRVEYGIADRRPRLDRPMLRHRDEDLLPFPLADTIHSDEALRALGYVTQRPLIHMIEDRRFDAYSLNGQRNWRISRTSFKRFLEQTRDKKLMTWCEVAAMGRG